ncbi:sensor histidine kinase [Dyella solisilvae]|uniref:Sensor histidine kinase n=1 Tax=Dyella solisilvae TaxID=1920168 RepID=A0A370K8T9_9GAMM|nr:histidine kinase [Dyella solisilvae]RDI99053.1 sensor histidine kinase [Dyella solisilvae]
MTEASTEPAFNGRAERLLLPDFCSLPVIFALLVVGAIAVTVMWLAPNNGHGWRGYSMGMLFANWLALVIGVSLCKLRPLLQKLPGHAPYGGVWLVMMAIVAVGSALVHWIDSAMQMELLGDSAEIFVLNNSAIAALLGAAMLRYFYLQAQWQTRLAAVAKAQVAALQARIRPHFLFNSMNTVAALVRVDPAAAERTVEDLSELFRAALGEHGTRDGTLGEELTLVDRYLAIEQLRLGERLHVRRELDDLPADFPLPRLLLQPLVENAVRHGIQPSREGGEVILRGRHERGGIVVEIDNPCAHAPTPGGHGHGLDNVRQRVAYRYGARARVTAGAEGGRFVVRLQLPDGEHARTDR